MQANWDASERVTELITGLGVARAIPSDMHVLLTPVSTIHDRILILEASALRTGFVSLDSPRH